MRSTAVLVVREKCKITVDRTIQRGNRAHHYRSVTAQRAIKFFSNLSGRQRLSDCTAHAIPTYRRGLSAHDL